MMRLDDSYLDELQEEAEKLVTLLKDRQPGLASWVEVLKERRNQITELLVMGRRYDPELIREEQRKGWDEIARETLQSK